MQNNVILKQLSGGEATPVPTICSVQSYTEAYLERASDVMFLDTYGGSKMRNTAMISCTHIISYSVTTWSIRNRVNAYVARAQLEGHLHLL